MTSATKTSVSPPTENDLARCPLCGGPNDCRLCTTAAYKGSCWCAAVEFPAELLACVPAEQRNRACICRACMTAFHHGRSAQRDAGLRPGDHYFDQNGLMVFTAQYHLRRGFCCGNNCRHCPYPRSLT
jgi:hypothetical protein